MLSYSKLITQLQTLILFSNLFFPSKLKGVFRPFWTWLYKLTILYWKPDFRPTCMLKSYTMLIKWGTFLTSKTLLFKSLINDDKVFDTCNLSFQKKIEKFNSILSETKRETPSIEEMSGEVYGITNRKLQLHSKGNKWYILSL